MEVKKKSLAGRPPKTLIRKLENRRGIYEKPEKEHNVFELSHDNPDVFKSLFECGKRIVKGNIMMRIMRDKMQFVFSDNKKRCTAITEIYGSKLVKYYSRIDKAYTCQPDKIIKILKLKKKSHNKIIFAISEYNQYTLNIIFSYGDDISETWSAPLDNCGDFQFDHYNEIFHQSINYTLKFKLKWPHFKDVINCWKQFTNHDLRFEKDIDTPLQIAFKDGQVASVININNNAYHNVEFNCNEFFAVEVPIMNLLDISASSDLDEDLHFYLKEGNIMILFSKLDSSFKNKKEMIPDSETMQIKFFVEIK